MNDTETAAPAVPAIRTAGLRKEYGDTVAVEGLDLEIRDGELFALLGVNGAGKTTTIKMLTCLCRPTSGEAFVLGHSVTREPERIRPLIDVSMQETAVARNLTVEENIAFCAGLAGLGPEDAAAAREMLYRVFGLGSVKNKRASKLSGGWQRKLSVGLALVSAPRVLFLDEPTLGLDVIARRELWTAIRSLRGKMTIVLTTHYMEEAEALADRIGIMKDGRLLFTGTKEELFAVSGAGSVEEAFIRLVEGGTGND